MNNRQITVDQNLLRLRVEALPEDPGVYLFRGRNGKIIYIGKAKSLKHRVRSYFQASRHLDHKTEFLKRRIHDVEYVVTDSEIEALILESSLVKKHQPGLNVRLKDDKAFLHIKLTVQESFPRVLLTRRIANDGALYFGPYLPASLARNTVKIINRHFLLRTCDIDIDAKRDRPCLEYYIRRCLGPCVAGLCTRDEYLRAVDDVILLLQGKNEELLESLREKMRAASEEQRFEAAAFYRDRIQMIEDLAKKQKMALSGVDDVDVFAYYREGPRLALQLFTLRNGRVVGKREFYWEDLKFFDPPDFLRDAIQQYYHSAGFVPGQIYLPVEIEDQGLLSEWLSQRLPPGRRRKVQFSVPKRGEKHDLLLLVERNAKIAFESRFKIPRAEKFKVLEQLQQKLDLPIAPRRIEAFDVSNIQGSETVASMVVCESGRMNRSQYRKYRIRSVQGPDDFSSIREAVKRRYRRVLEEGAVLPDLILVDGGKGQLHMAYQALAELGIEDVPLASIAKKEERIYIQGQEQPVLLEWTLKALHLIQEIRDEAHRFAVSYHRKRRSLRDFNSELDTIPGIGKKRKRRLLQNFGSVARIRAATVRELTPFLGRKLAETVKQHLQAFDTSQGS